MGTLGAVALLRIGSRPVQYCIESNVRERAAGTEGGDIHRGAAKERVHFEGEEKFAFGEGHWYYVRLYVGSPPSSFSTTRDLAVAAAALSRSIVGETPLPLFPLSFSSERLVHVYSLLDYSSSVCVGGDRRKRSQLRILARFCPIQLVFFSSRSGFSLLLVESAPARGMYVEIGRHCHFFFPRRRLHVAVGTKSVTVVYFTRSRQQLLPYATC
ncbi:hypothetical protein R1flu_007752 [Riccia fluitans]|uniref:Uncharacterized protein n=1 Tax=Riccia fluitans TaxID=41844 RepID=A0ABD1YZR9_9MARC